MKLKLNEKMGIPLGIDEESDILYHNIISDIRKSDLDEENNLIGKYYISIEEMKLYLPVYVNLRHHDGVDNPTLLGLSVNNPIEFEKNDSNIIVVNKKNGHSLIIRIVYNELINDRSSIIDSIENLVKSSNISHELKHLYDNFKNTKESIERMSQYHSYQISGFPYIISEFLHLLYYMTTTENLVRPSELYKELLNNGINKGNFMEYMRTSEIIKKINISEKFTLDDFMSKLNRDVDVESQLKDFESKGFNRSGDNARDMMKLIFINISNHSIDHSKKILNNFLDHEKNKVINNLFDDLLFTHNDDVIELVNTKFNKIVNNYSKYQNKPDLYFGYLIKNLNFAGKKMKRKLYKLYDMVENVKNNDKQSILNWELHNKINSKNEGIIHTLDFDKFKNIFK